MLWVIIGHAFLGKPGEGPEWENGLYHFAYSFHMPLFMLVSGWLFFLTRLSENKRIIVGRGGQKWTYYKIVTDKAKRLLLPGLVFSLLAFILKIAFPGEMERQTGLSIQEISHAYVYPNDNPLRELWFIVTLFWYFSLTPFWRVVLKNKWLAIVTLIVLIIIYFFHPSTEFLCIDRVFRYAIWFYMGLLISQEDLVDKYMLKRPLLILLIGIGVYFIGMYVEPFITTIGGITLSFGLAVLLDRYIPKTFFTFRNYTYQIFLMGIFAQIFVKIIYRHASIPYVVAYVFCMLMGLYVPVFVSKCVERINWEPLCLCVGLRENKKKNNESTSNNN